MEYLYTKKQAEQLRQKIIETAVVPTVKANFSTYPQLKSATLFVAQYWNDEANDAVHCRMVYSVLHTPDLEAATKAQGEYALDIVNLPELSDEDGELRNQIFYPPSKDGEKVYCWLENGDAIPAFAAFCEEDCHQDMIGIEAYSPYAIFRCLNNDDIEIEVIGVQVRPWLDGINPSSIGF